MNSKSRPVPFNERSKITKQNGRWKKLSRSKGDSIVPVGCSYHDPRCSLDTKGSLSVSDDPVRDSVVEVRRELFVVTNVFFGDTWGVSSDVRVQRKLPDTLDMSCLVVVQHFLLYLSTRNKIPFT